MTLNLETDRLLIRNLIDDTQRNFVRFNERLKEKVGRAQ